jgi:SulP family sulfate permease
MFPLRDQLDGYTRADLSADLTAGLTTAVMLVPQGMAYAMLAGLEPIVGLYASTLPLLVYGVLGTSRQLAVGPVAMVSLLVAAGVGPLAAGDPVRFTTLATVLAAMVGVLQWGMGVARIGALVKFLSHPVIAGFTSAAALLIGASQLRNLLGVDLPRSHFLHETLLAVAERAAEIDPATTGLGLAALGTLVALKRWAPGVPRFLLVVVVGSVAVWSLDLDVAIVGDVPSGLPAPSVPWTSTADLWALLPTALTIAFVGFLESISVARKFASTHRYRIDADQELVALGLANVGGAFLGAYPVTGGFSRTAVNDQAGARTNVASLVTAAAVLLTLLFLTPLFTFLTKTVLTAIVLSAVAGLVDLEGAAHLWRVSRPDAVLMGLTFVATLTLGIEPGIAAGVTASLLWFIWRTSRPHVARLGQLPGSSVYRNVARYPEARSPASMVALRIDAPLYFANTAFLLDTVEDAIDADTEHLVLDCKVIGSIDAQALHALEELFDLLDAQGVGIWLAGVRGPVRDALDAAHLRDRATLVERVHEAAMAIAPLRRSA